MLLFILHLGQFSCVGHWTFGARGSYSSINKLKVNLRLNSEVMSPLWGLRPAWSSPRCGWTRARAGCCQGCWACRQPCWRVPECVIWSSWSWWGLVVTWKCRAQSRQLNRRVIYVTMDLATLLMLPTLQAVSCYSIIVITCENMCYPLYRRIWSFFQ